MQVGLIKNSVVENVIEASDVDTAQKANQGYLCIQRTPSKAFGPGWTTADNGQTFTAPPQPATNQTGQSGIGLDLGLNLGVKV